MQIVKLWSEVFDVVNIKIGWGATCISSGVLIVGIFCQSLKKWPGVGHHNIWVRHEGARCQRVEVPPGKLSVHPGSYPDSGLERSSC